MSKKQSSSQEQILPDTAEELQKELAVLRASEARYHLLFEASPNALFLIGQDGRFLDANQAALDWYGYSLEEFKKMTPVDLAASEELKNKALGKVRRAVQEPTHFEWRHRRKDGRELPVEINTMPVKIGEEACTFAIVRDITERKLAEEAIHDSEQKYRTLFESMRQGVFYQQADGQLIDVNPAALEMLGINRDTFLGRDSSHPEWRVIREDGSPLPAQEHPSMVALQTGKLVADSVIGVFNPQKKKYVWMTINAVPEFRAGENVPYRAAVTLHDITERKQVEIIAEARLRLLKFSESHSLSELLRATLDELEVLTESRIGFYHFLEADQKTLSLQTWSTRTLREMCTAEGAGRHYNIAEAGVWVDCIREQRAVIHNDYASLPSRKGMPDGHAVVIRELVVPVFRGDQIVAILGVGNKPRDYTEVDIDIVAKLADLAWDITERKQAENALRDLSEHLTHMFTNSPTIVYELRIENGQAVPNWISANIEPILGFSAQEALQADWWQGQIHPQDRARAVAALEHLFDDFYQHEYRFLRKDGREIWIHDEHRLLRDADNKPSEIIGTWVDITERKKNEQALRESEDKFKYLFDHSALGKSITLVTGEINVNQALCEMLGYSAEELQNKKWQEISHPDDLELTQTEINALLAGQRNSTQFVKRYLHKNGSVVWTEVGSTLRRDADGKPLYFMTSVNNITARKQAEDALRQAERRASALIENAPDGIVFVSPEGKFTYVSPPAYKLFGYNASELSQLSPNELTHPEDLPMVLETLGGLMQDPASVPTIQYRFRHKDGRWLWIESTFSNLVAESAIKAIVINFRDISERKLIETSLHESTQQTRAIIDNAPFGAHFYEWRPEQGLVFVGANRAADSILGVDNQQFVGKIIEEAFPPLAETPIPNAYRHVAVTGERYETEQVEYDDRTIRGAFEVHAFQTGPNRMAAFFRDITERKLSEAERQALLEIMQSAAATDSLQDFLALVHRSLAGVIDAENISVVFYNKSTGLFEEVYAVDKFDAPMPPSKLTKSITSYVFRSGEPLLLNQAKFDELVAQDEVELVGTNSPSWLGAPLKIPGETIGVIAVQNYEKADRYSERDRDFLTSVCTQVSLATERKRADEALRKSEERFSTIFRVNPAAVALTRMRDNQLIDVNKAWLDMTGYKHAEVVGHTASELNLWIDFSEREQMVEMLRREGQAIGEVKIRRKSGDIWHVLMSGEIIELAGEQYLLTMAQDITERKQAEEKVRQRSEELAQLNAVSREISTSLNLKHASSAGMNGILNAIRPDMAFLFLRKGEKLILTEVLPHNASARFDEIPDHRVGECMCGAAVVENKALFTRDVFSDLRCTWQECKRAGVKSFAALPLRSGDKVIGVVGLASDTERDFEAQAAFLETLASQVSVAVVNAQLFEDTQNYAARLEQRVAERTRELQDAQEKLLRQEKLAVLGQLAGGVGHELRNPLSVITNAIYLLRLVQAEASPQVKEYLGIIEQETHTAEQIINDLLEFSRTKSVDRELVSVKEMLQRVLERFPAPENVTVKFKLPADLPPVFADPRHLQQIFGNLTVNACQAMGQGGTLTLSAKKKGKEIAIAVADTGTGITPENMSKLFEPLFTTKAKGIGLGLAVSRKLVEVNNGRIEVQSELGKGTVFTVYLNQKVETSK